MKIIKISSGLPENKNLLLRQTENFSGVWGDCKFYVNEKIEKCDWWFVLHGSGLNKMESCLCDPDHVIYVSMEPDENMSKVSNKFLSQFSCLITCDRKVIHQKKIYQNWITWWVGILVNKLNKNHEFRSIVKLNYDQLTKMDFPEKQNRISIIISNKNFSEGHRNRLNFIEKIRKLPISKYIDIYGHGYNHIPNKWDAIINYKYHLVLENSRQKDYWSEKLGDAFLGFALPIYYGCPNIYEYFDRDSLILIDINDVNNSVKVLQDLIDHDVFQNKKAKLKVAREAILNKYNIFNLMSKLANKKASNYQKITLNTNAYFTDSILKKLLKKLIL